MTKSIADMIKRLIFFCIFIYMSALPSMAYFSSIGLTPLKIDMSARALSLGEAFSAIPDIDSEFYNPGSMPWAKGISVNIRDGANIAASQAYPTGNDMTLGLSFASYKFSNIKISGGGSGETSGSMMLLSYSTKLSALPFIPQEEDLYRNLGIGASIKFLLNAGLSETGKIDKSGTGFDLDTGIFYKASPWLSFGASANNALPYKMWGGGAIKWTGIEGEESIPAYYRLGTAAKLIGDLRSPIFIENQELILSADVEKNQQNTSYKLGGDYTYANTYSLRFGLSSLGNSSFGAGYKTHGWGLNISMSKSPLADGNIFTFNVLYFPEEWHFLSHPFVSLIPEDGYTTYNPTTEISGKVKPGIDLFINQESVPLDPDNSFKHTVRLEIGQNLITSETYYEGDKLTNQMSIIRKDLPKNPFAYLNIYDNYTTDDKELLVEGRLLQDAGSVTFNGKKLILNSDNSFSTTMTLKNGQNIATSEVIFEGLPVKNEFVIFKRVPAPPIIEAPKPKLVQKIKKTKHLIKKPIKKKHIKRVKKIDKSLLKTFAQIQAIIKAKTNATILAEAEMKISGYFAVYVLSDFQYIALRDLRNGMISIDYYETKKNRWRTLSTASYSELLLFKTSRTGDYIDVYLDN